MNTKGLQKKQLQQMMDAFQKVGQETRPPLGWVKSIRSALGISLEQLAKKLKVSKQNVQMLESREREQSITLRSLQEMANALDMQLVYGMIPKDGSLNALIERKAEQIAKEIVERTSQNMSLEDQKNSAQRLKEAIQERKAELMRTLPKTLWD